MGGHADRRTVYYGAVIHNDYVGIWQVFQAVYLYCHSTRTPFRFCWRAEPKRRQELIKSYAAVCLEGAVIVLTCIIFSLFASSPHVVNPDAAAVTMVWSYIGELVFNMLVLVGAVKMADRVVREMMGL